MCAVEKQESGLPSEGSALELRIAASLPNLHQLRLRRRRRHRHRLQILRVAPVIQNPYLLHAGNRAPQNLKPMPMTPSADRKSTRLNSSHLGISYAVFCLKKKKK